MIWRQQYMKGLKKWLCGIVCMGLLTGMAQPIFAYDTPETIKIGLVSVCKNATSATIGGNTLRIGFIQNDVFQESGTISSGNGFRVSAVQTEVIGVGQAMSQEEAKTLAYSLSKMQFDVALAYLGDQSWTVYVKNSSRFEIEQAMPGQKTETVSFAGILIEGGEQDCMIAQTVNYALGGAGTENTFMLEGKSYRGYLSFQLNGQRMTAINTVDLEEYLCGVVPAEMPASYAPEALKAQALSARTYAMTKISAHTDNGYALCDTIHCQVYKGYDVENAGVNDLVHQTEGEVICYQGTPIQAVFSASSGGYTENSEDVWTAPVPYLRAVPEVAGEYGDNSWTKTVTLSELDALVKSKGENIGNVTDIVITKLATSGRVQEMKIVGTSGDVTLTKENVRTYFSGACGSLPSKMFTINGKGGAQGVTGEQNQTTPEPTTPQTPQTTPNSLKESAEQYGVTAITQGTLSGINGNTYQINGSQAKTTQTNTTSTATNTTTPSQATNGTYAIYDVNISTIQNGTFVFSGNGNGHGVGLSQNGAQAMAQNGYSYIEILQHYYTGVTIEE